VNRTLRQVGPTARALALLIVPLLWVTLAGCHGVTKPKEFMYVSVPQVTLRDRVATVYNKVGTLTNGDRVEVLDRQKRFVKVRTEKGTEGWVEERYLEPEKLFRDLQELASRHAKDPVQGKSIARAELKLHVTPARDSDSLYRLTENEKVDLLQRTTAVKSGPTPVTTPDEKEPPPQPMEDWWLVRDSDGHTGYVIARMLDLDVPLEVAQYAEGQRVVAAFTLNTVKDLTGKAVAQYLMVLTDPKDGLPYDFNQIRVFTWNVKRSRYETAYRERIFGLLPVRVGHQVFDKEGDEPTFTIIVKNEDGSTSQRTYRMNGVIVKRVLQPGEEPEKALRPKRAALTRKKH
jgi:SH3-like domain-containing protein